MNAYWSQWEDEIDSMHGTEDDTDLDLIEYDTDLIQIQCCGGMGCNYCLMVS